MFHIIKTCCLLLNHVLQISQWAVKGIVQAESMMREARLRIQALEKKTKKCLEPGMKSVFLSMMFANPDHP